MIKIIVDARAVQPKIDGKGRYIGELIRSWLKTDDINQYILLVEKELPFKLKANFKQYVLPKNYYPKFKNISRQLGEVFFSPTSFLLPLLTDLPTVITVHDLAVFLESRAKPAFKTKLIEKLTLARALKKSKKIIAVSYHTKEDLVNYFAVDHRKITVTHLAAAPKSSKPTLHRLIKTKYKLPDRYIFFTGTLEPRKNVIGLLEAYSLLRGGLKKAVPLILAGRRGWNSNEIDVAIRKLKIGSSVKELGFVSEEDLTGLLEMATVFVYPSFYEGFGLPVLEAMRSGAPVITSKTSSLPEVAGSAGILINPDSPDEIAKAIEKVLANEDYRQKLKLKSLEQSAKFSWDKTAEQTLKVLINALD